MREKKRKKKEARRFGRYIQLKRQASLARMISEVHDSIDTAIIALEMIFPKYSEAYARI